ncbi:MAG: polyprenyl synthetase family protein [Candidatus Omnitrophica bacterium]|nr:polyprenyl synthetase family protein [Candidatus Omnitrophota bacterium]MDD5653283.1 polyprenyl synthetase family protein [Candidatus Omnitrophota bacterium]
MKNTIEKELLSCAQELKKNYSLHKISPLLINYIKNFISREGKRVRPLLLILGYQGFVKRASPGLYRSAVSIELLHDFMLVHDDIIDKSEMRRGKPSVHKMLNDYLRNYPPQKFSGEDLGIVVGDVLYAMGIDTFLAIKEKYPRKEEALKQLVRAALYTGSGEFIELLCGTKTLDKVSKEDIYKIYDYKTAYYTFSSPLAIGAILAGAPKKETERMIKYGIYLGRAFQIKDDIIGMFEEEKKIGKSTLTDLQEAKKTLLIWYAYNHSNKAAKKSIRKIMEKKVAKRADLLVMRRIISDSKALDYAKNEVTSHLSTAKAILQSSKMRPKYKSMLDAYAAEILKV